VGAQPRGSVLRALGPTDGILCRLCVWAAGERRERGSVLRALGPTDGILCRLCVWAAGERRERSAAGAGRVDAPASEHFFPRGFFLLGGGGGATARAAGGRHALPQVCVATAVKKSRES
jgi:hypothetical protein